MATRREEEERRREQQQADEEKKQAAENREESGWPSREEIRDSIRKAATNMFQDSPFVQLMSKEAERQQSAQKTAESPTKPFDNGDFGNTTQQTSTPQPQTTEGQQQQADKSQTGTQGQANNGLSNRETRKFMERSLPNTVYSTAKMALNAPLDAAYNAMTGERPSGSGMTWSERNHDHIAKLVNPTSFVKPENMSPEDSKKWDHYYNDVSNGDNAEISRSTLAALMREHDPNSINEFLKHGSESDFLRENSARNSISRENGGYMYTQSDTESRMQDFYKGLSDHALREAESYLTERLSDPDRGKGYRVGGSKIGGTEKLEARVEQLRKEYLNQKGLDPNDPVTKARMEGRVPTAQEYAATNKPLWDKYVATNKVIWDNQAIDRAKRLRGEGGDPGDVEVAVPEAGREVSDFATSDLPTLPSTNPFDNGDFGNTTQQTSTPQPQTTEGQQQQAAPAQGTGEPAPDQQETQGQRGQQADPTQGTPAQPTAPEQEATQQPQSAPAQRAEEPAGQQPAGSATVAAGQATKGTETPAQTGTQEQPQEQQSQTSPTQGATPQPKAAEGQQQQAAGQTTEPQTQGDVEVAVPEAGREVSDFATSDLPTLPSTNPFDNGDFGNTTQQSQSADVKDEEEARKLVGGDTFFGRLSEANERRQGRLERAQAQADQRMKRYSRMSQSQLWQRARSLARKADYFAARGKKNEAELYKNESDLVLAFAKGENPADAVQAQAEAADMKYAEALREDEKAQASLYLSLSKNNRDRWDRLVRAENAARRAGQNERANEINETRLKFALTKWKEQLRKDNEARTKAAREQRDKDKKEARDRAKDEKEDYNKQISNARSNLSTASTRQQDLLTRRDDLYNSINIINERQNVMKEMESYKGKTNEDGQPILPPSRLHDRLEKLNEALLKIKVGKNLFYQKDETGKVIGNDNNAIDALQKQISPLSEEIEGLQEIINESRQFLQDEARRNREIKNNNSKQPAR